MSISFVGELKVGNRDLLTWVLFGVLYKDLSMEKHKTSKAPIQMDMYIWALVKWNYESYEKLSRQLVAKIAPKCLEFHAS